MTEDQALFGDITWGDPNKRLGQSYKSVKRERALLGVAYLTIAGSAVLLSKPEQRHNLTIWIVVLGFLFAAYFFAFGLAKIVRKVLISAEFSESKVILRFHQFSKEDPEGRLIIEKIDWPDIRGFTVPFADTSDRAKANVVLYYKRQTDSEVESPEMEFIDRDEAMSFASMLGNRFRFIQTSGYNCRKFIRV